MLQFSSSVPSASPGNITVVEITSHSVSLMWIPPAREYQNGIIIGYIINVTVEQTGEMHQLYSNTTNITATLDPFITYTIVITAENSVGTGPYTEVLNIQSEETGNCLLLYEIFTCFLVDKVHMVMPVFYISSSQ